VGKGKWKGSRSTDNSSGGGVLRSVAWAHELVVGSRPWDNTSQVSAHSIKTIVLKRSVLLNNKVCGISLKTLGKRVVTSLVGGEVILLKQIISKSILGGDSSSSTSGTRGDEEEDVRNSKSSNGNGGRADEDQVHEVSAVLVNVEFTLSGGHADGGDSLGALLNIDRSRSKCGGGADEGGGEKRKELHGCRFG
jgi:hypothetical protein